MEKYPKTKITYLRHALAESNQRANIGVHIYDPEILRGQKDADYGYGGQSLCRDHLLPTLKRSKFTHIAVSPSARTLSTMIQSIPIESLTTAEITVMPILEEQTHWMSDRPRSVKDIQRLIKKELIDIGHPDSKPLQINFLPLLQHERDLKSILDQFEQDRAGVFDEQEILAHEETLKKPWHTKTGLYDTQNLKKRGLAVVDWLRTWTNAGREHNQDCPKFLVVGHGGIVNFFVEEVGDIDMSNGKLSAWRPGEMRDYWVTTSALLEETAESRQARLKNPSPPYLVKDENDKRTALHQAVVKLHEEERFKWPLTSVEGFEPLYKTASKSISDRIPGTDDYNTYPQEPTEYDLGGNLRILYHAAPQPDSEKVFIGILGGRLKYLLPEALRKDGGGTASVGYRHNAHVYVTSMYTCASNTPPPVGEKAIEDIEKVIKFVHKRHSKKMLIIWGWSAGALLVTRAKHDVKVALTVLSYGTLSLDKDIRHVPTCENFFGEKATDEWIADWNDRHPPTRPTGQLYMIHGSNDSQVLIENTLQYAERMYAEGVPLMVECNPEGDHGDLRMEDHHRLRECLSGAPDESPFIMKSLDFGDIRQRVRRGEFVMFQNFSKG